MNPVTASSNRNDPLMRCQPYARLVTAFIILWLFTPTLSNAQHTQSLAILDLKAEGVSVTEAASLTNRLITGLVQTGRLTIVERSEMRQILGEQDFQLTDCTSDACAVTMGQLLGVSTMLAGSIGKVGSTYSVDLRTIDVETGKIINTFSYDYKGEVDELLNMMAIIAEQFAPVIAGQDPEAAQSGIQTKQQIRSQTEQAETEVTENSKKSLPEPKVQIVPIRSQPQLSKLKISQIPQRKSLDQEAKKEISLSQPKVLTQSQNSEKETASEPLPPPDVLFAQAEQFKGRSSTSNDAVTIYEKILHDYGDDPEFGIPALQGLATISYKQKQYDSAVVYYLDIASRYSTNNEASVGAILAAADIYETNLKNLDAAFYTLEMIIDKYPDYPGHKSVQKRLRKLDKKRR